MLSEYCCEHHREAKHSWVHSCRSTLPLAEPAGAACSRTLPQLGCLQPTQHRYVTPKVGTSLDQGSPPCFRALVLSSGLSSTTATPALGCFPSDHWSSAVPYHQSCWVFPQSTVGPCPVGEPHNVCSTCHFSRSPICLHVSLLSPIAAWPCQSTQMGLGLSPSAWGLIFLPVQAGYCLFRVGYPFAFWTHGIWC